MPTKSLRILIADTERTEALKIERALNGLGYYRIASLDRIEALLGLRDAEKHAFDVLLISQRMANLAGLDCPEARKESVHFKHVLLYDSAPAILEQLNALMQAIDVQGAASSRGLSA